MRLDSLEACQVAWRHRQRATAVRTDEASAPGTSLPVRRPATPSQDLVVSVALHLE